VHRAILIAQKKEPQSANLAKPNADLDKAEIIKKPIAVAAIQGTVDHDTLSTKH
jgi:hypothetical protein